LLNPRGASGETHHAPRAKRVISLFMHGGPSQLELFDPKPGLKKLQGEDLPESIRRTQRLTGMTSGQKSFPVASSIFGFRQAGTAGTWVSELLPRLGAQVDQLCIIRSLYTEAINHDPAVTLLQTGHQQPGRPSLGAWTSYGLGDESADLPAFVVMISRGSAARPADPLYARLWGAGFLPARHQGVSSASRGRAGTCSSAIPKAIDAAARREQLDALAQLNRRQSERQARSRDRSDGSRSTNWRYRMQSFGARPHAVRRGNSGYVRRLRSPGTSAGDVRGELPAGAAHGGARREVHPTCIIEVGTSITTCRATCGCSAKISTSPAPRCWPI
jgi:hypothetical protein